MSKQDRIIDNFLFWFGFVLWILIMSFLISACESKQVEPDWFPPELIRTEITDEGWYIQTFSADSTHLPVMFWLKTYYHPKVEERLIDWLKSWHIRVKIIYDNRMVLSNDKFIIEVTAIPTWLCGWTHSEIWEEVLMDSPNLKKED